MGLGILAMDAPTIEQPKPLVRISIDPLVQSALNATNPIAKYTEIIGTLRTLPDHIKIEFIQKFRTRFPINSPGLANQLFKVEKFVFNNAFTNIIQSQDTQVDKINALNYLKTKVAGHKSVTLNAPKQTRQLSALMRKIDRQTTSLRGIPPRGAGIRKKLFS